MSGVIQTTHPQVAEHAVQALKETTRAEHSRAPGINLKEASGVLVDFIVLTNDPGLIQQTQEASAGRHALWFAKTAEEVVEHLVAGRCGILLADLQVLRGNSKAFFERLNQQFPTVVLIATGKREEEGEVAQLITAGRIYRFLHKPLSPGRTQQFVTAATRRFNELNPRESGSFANVADLAREHVSPTLLKNGARVLAGIAVLAIAAVLFQTLREHLASRPQAEAPPVAAVAPAAVPTSSVAEAAQSKNSARPAIATNVAKSPPKPAALPAATTATAIPISSAVPGPVAGSPIKAMLDHAMLAMEQGRLMSPTGDNALELVRQAQGIAPDDSRLLITATALGQRLVSEANAAIAANDVTAAEQWLAAAQALDADLGLHLPEMQSVVAALDSNAQQARDREMRMLVSIATERREAGLLIEPQGGSAYDQISSLRERDPSSPIVAAEVQRLVTAMVERAKASIARNDLHYSRRLLMSIESLAPNSEGAKPVRRELDFAEKQSQALREAIPANNLKRVLEVAPEYPLVARERGTEGWVEVEFTIEKDGSVTSPVVRSAEPLDVFNKSALDAVKRWRFQPVIYDGRVIVQRAYLRLSFKLR